MAFWCGMIFSVYAQPNAIIVKSDVACITTFNTERRLVFRVASAWRMRPIVQGSVRLYAWFIPQKSAEGKKKRGALSFQQTELKLKRDGEHPFMRMPVRRPLLQTLTLTLTLNPNANTNPNPKP